MEIVNDLYSKQLDLEAAMFRASADKLRAEIAKAKERDAEDSTQYAARLMTAKLSAVAEGVREFMAPFLAGKPSRKAIAIKFLRLLEPEVSAAIGLKGVLAGISKRRTVQGAAILIGRMVEDELLWREFEAQAPDAAKVTENKIRKAPSERHRRRVVGVMAGRAGIDRIEMTKVEQLNVGTKLLEIVVETSGLAEITRSAMGSSEGMARNKRGHMLYLTPRTDTLDWIERFTSWSAVVSPIWWPMVSPPKPWVSPDDGGYYTKTPRPLTLIKNARKEQLDKQRLAYMPQVYAAINAVQETAYRIDDWVLAILEAVWQRDLAVAGIIRREPDVPPAKPEDIATNEEARKAWRKSAALVYANNVKILSRRVQLDQGMKMARRFAEEPAIYFPHQYDFRGRMYAVPMISYQGPDWMKGILRFAEGKPINDALAAGYLMMQGAALWGEDKGSLDDRMAWVEAHAEQIRLAGTDPLSNYWWADADKPWQFLQWCREWSQFMERGYGFVSSFICSADGACNGLQHFSAMLRDLVGGAAVNLVPMEKPADIYAKVAEIVTAKLRLIASSTGDDMASKWLAFGVDRKITKRAVMVLPYGGTQYSTREFIELAVREKLGGVVVDTHDQEHRLVRRVDTANPFATTEEDGVFAASLFLAPIVWNSIGEVVVAARAAMGWLKGAAKLVAKDDKPVTWTMPDGFLVEQAYYETKDKRVVLQVSGTVITLMIREELPSISKRRQEQGVSPNFVHSCDGLALRQYVVTAKENGISSFAVVHDSYGTVAADYTMMQACLRDAFVSMYQEHDVLERLRDNLVALLPEEQRAEMPELPPRGELDLEGVKYSDFFFA